MTTHWNFVDLPPFFTMQPVPGTFQRQLQLWADLLMDHALWAASLLGLQSSSSSVLRMYTVESDIFFHPTHKKRLPKEAVLGVFELLVQLYPNLCAILKQEDQEEDAVYGVLIATCDAGGFAALEASLLKWVLEVGGGLTTSHLSAQGVVTTLEELSSASCLYYHHSSSVANSTKRGSEGEEQPIPTSVQWVKDAVTKHHTGCPVRVIANPPSPSMPSHLKTLEAGQCGAVSEVDGLRLLLQVLLARPTSLLRPLKMTMFNCDGSGPPYQGVKFGGQ